MESFGSRLKELRKARKLTQARLAEIIGVQTQLIHRWETSVYTPQMEKLLLLADAFQVSLDELVGRMPTVAPEKVKSPWLHDLMLEVDNLPDKEQQAIQIMLESLVKKNKVASIFK